MRIILSQDRKSCTIHQHGLPSVTLSVTQGTIIDLLKRLGVM